METSKNETSFADPSKDSTDGKTDYSGVGPKNYQRKEASILDEINSRLTISSEVDASHIRVEATDGLVTLTGTVASRTEKHRAEDIALNVRGVKDVRNLIHVIPWREVFAQTH